MKMRNFAVIVQLNRLFILFIWLTSHKVCMNVLELSLINLLSKIFVK